MDEGGVAVNQSFPQLCQIEGQVFILINGDDSQALLSSTFEDLEHIQDVGLDEGISTVHGQITQCNDCL